MKAGWKTTEFWLTLVAGALGTTIATGGIEVGSPLAKGLAVAAGILAMMGYSVSRGIAKRGGAA
jgi:hypothetical protein